MASDIKKKNDKDLIKELKESKVSLREFRFGMSGSKTKNVKEGRNLKKLSARIMTEINQRSK
ncbi:MAG: 50S ribosomal protein L29 [Parcubacteria group bacterium CG11_big_fil_rev_8_21_14_0_20_39_22]|nr:MAG: 50S ribosomal protein L29 [Parcubacteria group bacterium CG11_big_fil_rev_8_21_14_0_20_39_22]